MASLQPEGGGGRRDGSRGRTMPGSDRSSAAAGRSSEAFSPDVTDDGGALSYPLAETGSCSRAMWAPTLVTSDTAPPRIARPGVAPATSAPAPVIVPPETLTPGLARPALPLRREGPAKLTGAALYTDDLVFPGAWSGATIRSTDAHARLL